MEQDMIIEVTLGPFLMLTIQMLKSFMPFVEKYPLPFVFVGAAGLTSFIVDFSQSWQEIGIGMFAGILAIAGIAAGAYSVIPKKEEVTLDIPDYSDDK